MSPSATSSVAISRASRNKFREISSATPIEPAVVLACPLNASKFTATTRARAMVGSDGTSTALTPISTKSGSVLAVAGAAINGRGPQTATMSASVPNVMAANRQDAQAGRSVSHRMVVRPRIVCAAPVVGLARPVSMVDPAAGSS
jgi:hypothetical protein